MTEWRIYYADGTRYSGSPEDAPGLGVLLIVQRDPKSGIKEILHGDGPRVIDYYWWEGGMWLGGDVTGMIQYLAFPGWKKVLIGRNIITSQWREVVQEAIDDDLS